MKILGFPIDSESRCKHYHSEQDIVSIKFKCCNHYYPCYKCHEESIDHPIERWAKKEFDKKAILCGICQTELTINEYMDHQTCTNCGTAFNPNCSLHYNIYFSMSEH